jgi:DNA-binding HxlR family transcriptional regulator
MACGVGIQSQLDSDWTGRRIALRGGAEVEPSHLVPRQSEEIADEICPPPPQIKDGPVQFAMALIQGKWKAGILSLLRHGPLRLSQLRRMIPGASKKMLTQHLREMEEDGLIVRSDLSDRMRRVEYSLSASLGVAALRLIDTLAQWGAEHTPPSSMENRETRLPDEWRTRTQKSY